MAAPDDTDQYERHEGDGLVLYVEHALAGEDEIEVVMPGVGTFTIRRP